MSLYRPFWIKWGQGVEVGHGLTVGSNIFLSYLSDTAPTGVTSLSLINGAVTQSGYWKVSNLEGNVLQHFHKTFPKTFPYKAIFRLIIK